jgi:hypothetical protein
MTSKDTSNMNQQYKKIVVVLEQALEEPITTLKNWACHVRRWGLGLIP